jgi:hypothetical protein
MTEQAISPLRRRMIEDMTIRKFAQKTHATCPQPRCNIGRSLGLARGSRGAPTQPGIPRNREATCRAAAQRRWAARHLDRVCGRVGP